MRGLLDGFVMGELVQIDDFLRRRVKASMVELIEEVAFVLDSLIFLDDCGDEIPRELLCSDVVFDLMWDHLSEHHRRMFIAIMGNVRED